MMSALHSPEYWAQAPQDEVERYAARLVINDPQVIGLARAELLRRDQVYDEEQAQRREALAQRQMDHAAKLSSEQLRTAEAAVKATKLAVWATIFAAIGAAIQAAMALMLYLK